MTQVIVWNAWLGGLAIGLYGLVQLMLSGKPLGVSTGYGNFCGMTCSLPFFRTGSYETLNNFRVWFIVGIPLGALLAALSSPGPLVASFSVGPMYDAVLPTALWAKGLVLLAGGTLMGLGARMANGCTSGHAIAGLSLLNWPSAVAAVGFFIGGIVSVQILFRVFG